MQFFWRMFSLTGGEVSRDVDLYEMKDIQDSAPGGLVETEGEIPQPPRNSGSDASTDMLVDEYSQDTPLRRSTRGTVPRRRYEIEGEAFMVASHDDIETRTVKEALSSPVREKWIAAMDEEMDSMRVNQVWDLVELPPERKAIGNKWVLKVKRKADGSIERYKARLVAKGYTQREGIDCCPKEATQEGGELGFLKLLQIKILYSILNTQ